MGLAEPKKKVKYSIDPNALHWANNEDKFGKRLMEKMGWQKGKGLGANENGMTEHIKVRFKSDTKGIGFKNEYDNVWLDHQDEFENLLNNLSKNNETSTERTEKVEEVKSLEERSRETKRLHYKKFAKSKDLSSVSADDLNCILGTQKRKMKVIEEPIKNSNSDTEDTDSFRPSFKQESSVKIDNEFEENLEENFGIKFSTNKLSVQDYFANKMSFKKNSNSKDTNGLNKNNLNEECESKIVAQEEKSSKKKKKKSKDKNENEMEVTDQISENFDKEKLEKKKISHQSIELSVNVESKESDATDSDTKKKKKKKKYKETKETEGFNISVKSEQTISAFDRNFEQNNEPAIEEEAESNQKFEKKKSKANEENKNVSLDEDKKKKSNDLDSLVKSSFKGSNLLSIYGYSAYFINSNLEEIINEKVKRLNRKRYIFNKKIEIDAEYYKMNKKMNV